MQKYILLGYAVLALISINYSVYGYSDDDLKKKENISIQNEKIIGMTTREFLDSTRSNWQGTGPRPIRVIIWYPGVGSVSKESGDVNISLVKDGNISAQSSKYPLVLISPGSGQVAASMNWLGFYLSSHGYITVAVTHKGSPEEERQNGSLTLTDFCIWERPKDLSIVLDNVLMDPVFADKIDINRIGAAGFSLGGATAIWAAGARINMDTLRKNSPPPQPILEKSINDYLELTKNDPIVKESVNRAENSYKDNRIKAVFAHSPAVGYGFTREGLSDIIIPIKIVVGEKDLIAPVETSAKRYAGYISNASLVVLPGELGHYTQQISEEERNKDLEQVSKLALEFFNKELKKQE